MSCTTLYRYYISKVMHGYQCIVITYVVIQEFCSKYLVLLWYIFGDNMNDQVTFLRVTLDSDSNI